MKYLLLLTFLSLMPTQSIAGSQMDSKNEVMYCSDGDTCRIKTPDGLWLNVRLFGIDAQENIKGKTNSKYQPFGIPARDALNTKIKGKTVELKQADLDRFNRPIVEMWYNNRNINLEMVKEGWAEVYRGKTKRINMGPYFSAENEARSKKLGIWNLKNYISPREFRKLSK